MTQEEFDQLLTEFIPRLQEFARTIVSDEEGVKHAVRKTLELLREKFNVFGTGSMKVFNAELVWNMAKDETRDHAEAYKRRWQLQDQDHPLPPSLPAIPIETPPELRKRRPTGARRGERLRGPTFTVLVNASVNPDLLADFLFELSTLYQELSGGDELVIREGRMPIPMAVLA